MSLCLRDAAFAQRIVEQFHNHYDVTTGGAACSYGLSVIDGWLRAKAEHRGYFNQYARNINKVAPNPESDFGLYLDNLRANQSL